MISVPGVILKRTGNARSSRNRQKSALRCKRGNLQSLKNRKDLAYRRALPRKTEVPVVSSFFPTGQVCGRMADIPSAGEVIERIVAEARSIMESLQDKMVSQRAPGLANENAEEATE